MGDFNDDDDIDDEVNDIISQIKNQSKDIKRVEKEKDPLKKEDMEEFILKHASAVVQDAVEIVGELKLEIMAGADAKLLEAYSEMLRATTSAIDSLAKLKLSDDKIKASKEITQMNIDAKQTTDDETKKGFLLSREEVIKALMNKKEDPEDKIVTIDVQSSSSASLPN